MTDVLQVLEDIAVFSADGPGPRLPPEMARDIAAELRLLRDKAAVLDSRWTLVAEQQPEADRRVLVMLPKGFVMMATRVVLGDSFLPQYRGEVAWEDDEGNWIDPHPVKWMPLPEGQP